MSDLISLAPQSTTPGISLVPPDQEVVAQKDPKVLQANTDKIDYALGASSPGKPEINRYLSLGFEDHLRQQASIDAAIQARQSRLKVVQDMTVKAAQEGRDLSTEEQQAILGMTDQELSDPNTVLERKFANRHVTEIVKPENSVSQRPVQQAVDLSIDYTTKQQIAQKVLENTYQKYSEQSWLGWGVDISKGLIPGYFTGKTAGLEGFFKGAGTSESEYFKNLYLQSPENFQREVSTRAAELAQDNPALALDYAQKAVSFSTQNETEGNLGTALDIIGVGELAKTAFAGTRALTSIRRAKTALKVAAAAGDPDVNRVVASGDIEGAAKIAVSKELTKPGEFASNAPPVGPVKPPLPEVGELRNQYSILNPKSFLDSPGSLTNEQQRRLLTDLTENQNLLDQSFTDDSHVVRLDSDAARQKGFAEADANAKRQYPFLEDAVLDVRNVDEDITRYAGVARREYLLGDTKANSFDNPALAQNYARNIYKLPDGAYDVVYKDGNYLLRISQNVDETSQGVLKARIGTNNQNPVNFINAYFGKIAGNEERLSKSAIVGAKTATYGANGTFKRLAEAGEALGSLKGTEAKDLESVMRSAMFKRRRVLDPSGKVTTVPGKFFDTVQEFETEFMNKIGRLPSYDQTRAYFTFRNIMNHDFVSKNVGVYRDLARQGVTQKSFSWYDKQAKIMRETPFVQGKTVTSLPERGASDYSIAWFEDGNNKPQFELNSRLFGDRREKLEDLIKNKGYKIIQMADPSDSRAFGEPVNYVVVKDFKEKPLSALQVPYAEGGHWIYPQNGFYLKQAKISTTGRGRRLYSGDNTLHWFMTEGEANKFKSAYETAIRMAKENNPDFDNFVSNNLPYSPKQFRQALKDRSIRDSQIVVTKTGQRVADLVDLGADVHDLQGSEHSLMGKVNHSYSQERGERLTSITNVGTEQSPQFKFIPTPVMEPYEALARSSADIAKGRFFDDLKHKTIEDFISQFGDILKGDPRQLAANPMDFLRRGEFVESADKARLRAGRNALQSLRYIIGEGSLEQKTEKAIFQKIIDTIHKVRGTDSTIKDPFFWDRQTDPVTIARSAVYNLKLGIWNVAQFPKQAISAGAAMAVDGNPVRAGRSVFMYLAHRYAKLAEINPAAQDLILSRAGKALGLPKQAMRESYDMWIKSGMYVNEGEFSQIDDYLNPKSFYNQSGIRRALKSSDVFFREGNAVHRGTSFNLSYLKWREANPTKPLNQLDLDAIVSRADLLYGNMTRVSNNPELATSLLSVPAQFSNYQARLSEQLLGTRLTGMEKARLMTYYSLMFGIPTGIAGSTLGVLWPMHEDFHQSALEQGYDNKTADLFTRVMVDGATSVALKALTGEDYDVASSMGPSGLSWAKDLADGKWWSTLSGPAGGMVGQAMQAAEPFWYSLYSVFHPENGYYELTPADYLGALRQVSTVNTAVKAYYLYTTGHYLAQDGSVVSSRDPENIIQTVTSGVLGVSPQDVSDTFMKLDSLKSQKEAKTALGKVAIENIITGLKYAGDNDVPNATLYYKRAAAIFKSGNFTPDEINSIREQAMSRLQPLADKANRKFWQADPQNRLSQYKSEYGLQSTEGNQ